MKRKERECFWDNLKFILILLVVIGHFVDSHTSISQTMKNIFLWIYSFHMPLFIFVSGYFSKNTLNGDKLKLNKLCSYLFLYTTLKIFLFLIHKYILNSSTVIFNLWSESNIPWYLLAMVIWLCLTYCIKGAKPKVILILSILVSFVIGYDKNVRDYLVLSRVMVFYPFFLTGYYVSKENVSKIINSRKMKLISIIILIASLILVAMFGDKLYDLRPFFTGRNPYPFIETPINGVFYRIAAFVISVTMSLSVLCIIPRKKKIYSSIGSRTLQIYFLHALVLPLYNNSMFRAKLSSNYPNCWIVVCIFIGFVVTIILSLKVFEYPFKKIMSIKFTDNKSL